MRWILFKIIEEDGQKMAKLKKTVFSIIIRTKNEEKWIGHCLEAVFSQKIDADLEVVIVDNNSNDNTVEVAKRYPIKKLVEINKFFPGKAINKGIIASTGDYIVCISAHCIPKNENWLKKLYQNLENNTDIAGVYGRQLPVCFTSDFDKRDLLITFGRDKKVQINDYFFHNANSMFSRDIWSQFPFDDYSSNIEDRIWGKKVIEAGYKIVYEPDAAVYHHHGLHQHENSTKRAKGIGTILDKIDKDIVGDLPATLKPENTNIASILLVNSEIEENSVDFKLLSIAVKELKLSLFVNSIYIVANNQEIATLLDIHWIDRNRLILNEREVNVEKLLAFSLGQIEITSSYPDSILYVNHNYPFRPKNLFDEIIIEMQYKGFDSVFPCFVDYGHYWKLDENNNFSQIDSSMNSRIDREPTMRALYGLGCISSSVGIRKGRLVGANAGIHSLNNFKYTINIRDEGSQEIIEKFL